MNRTLLTLVFCLITTMQAYANVPKASFPFADGDTIPISLSSVNINRIVVKNDRIINITCPRGFCTTTANQKDKTGSVSIKINLPLPFTAHIATQKGRLFALFITPKGIPAIINEFVPSDSHLEEQTVFERGFDYPSAIARFTKAMMIWQQNKTPISGFSVHPVDPKTLPEDTSSMPIIPKTVFVGRDYSGIIYEVSNRTDKKITLTNAQFYSYAARSAALDDYFLEPGASTQLYVVTGGGVQDVR